MTTPRTVRDEVKNILDFLVDAELALYANDVSLNGEKISWHSTTRAPFLLHHEHPTIEQYLAWAAAGHYSAILFDGSLLQISYSVSAGKVAAHRLAYIPCPYAIDATLLAEGEPVVDVVTLYRETDAVLRSAIRFDFDPELAGPDHPAVHLTVNSVDCRIACAAPVHALRFVDFVFRHFYPELWRAHRPFFESAAWRHAGPPTLVAAERSSIHIDWDQRARQSV